MNSAKGQAFLQAHKAKEAISNKMGKTTTPKRLRKNTKAKIRYFHCGEYGDQLKRPHHGEFDDQSGEIKSNAPTFIMNAPLKQTISQQIEESIETHL